MSGPAVILQPDRSACRSSRREKSAQKGMASDRFWNLHLYAPLGAVGRPRQQSALLTAWLVRGFFHRASRGEKTGAQIV